MKVLPILKYVEIQTQSYCNAKCLMCPYKNTSQYLPMGVMSNKLYKSIINQLAKDFNSIRNISLMLQNEPLLDKKIGQKIKFVKKKRQHYQRSFTIAITTNGVHLTDKLLLSLEKSGLDILNLSLTPPSRDKKNMSPGINFKKIIKNVLSYPKLKTLQLNLRIVLTTKNIENTILFSYSKSLKQIQKNNQASLEFLTLYNRAGSVKNYNNLFIPLNSLKKTGKKNVCTEPFNKINILFNGQVLICCHDWKRENIIGNANNKKLAQVWNGKKLTLIRKMIFNNNYKKIIPCKNCSIAKTILKKAYQ